jgi:fatty acid desaturase
MKDTKHQYWYVDGAAYDLKKFCKIHPGGEAQLVNLQGRDITEMVESMHSLVSLDKVKTVMKNYKVEDYKPDDDTPCQFTWKEDGFYNTLKKQVNDYFSMPEHNNPKSDPKFWVIFGLELAFQFWLASYALRSGSYFATFVCGLLTLALGFMVFHAAGHCGLSKSSKVNMFWYTLYGNYILGFIDRLWDIHHNYAHHCYTNVHRKDPDVCNISSFQRKSSYQKFKAMHKYQVFSTYIILCFYPGQWLGQILQYYLAVSKKKLFGVPLLKEIQTTKTVFHVYFGMGLVLMAILYQLHGLLTMIACFYIYCAAIGFLYWALVFPNHDTELSAQSSRDDVKGSDWGEHQLKHTSDFGMPDFLSYLTGGMNYQIEHHLFPTVHPRHYPVIAKMVQAECKKRNLPYNYHPSWFHALRGNWRHVVAMSKKEPTKPMLSFLAKLY